MVSATIRKAKKCDITELSRLYSLSYRFANVGQDWTPKTAKRLLLYLFGQNKKVCLVATDKGKLIGAFFAACKPACHGHIISDGELFVHPSCQKKGIGSRLVFEVFKKCRKSFRTNTASFSTFKKGHPLSWYKSIGFQNDTELLLIEGNIANIIKNLEKRMESG